MGQLQTGDFPSPSNRGRTEHGSGQEPAAHQERSCEQLCHDDEFACPLELEGRLVGDASIRAGEWHVGEVR